MDGRLKAVGVGLAAGLAIWALPDGFAPVVVIGAALVAGSLLPSQPVKAATLFLAPTMVGGAVRILLDAGVDPSVGEVALVLLSAMPFVAIFTHVGAGLALRRHPGVDST